MLPKYDEHETEDYEPLSIDLPDDEAKLIKPLKIKNCPTEEDFMDSWGGSIHDLPSQLSTQPFSPSLSSDELNEINNFAKFVDSSQNGNPSQKKNGTWGLPIRRIRSFDALASAKVRSKSLTLPNRQSDYEKSSTKRKTKSLTFPNRPSDDESSVKSSISRSSAYAGPTPLGPDGKPLRSCLASTSRSGQSKDDDYDTDSSIESTASTFVSNDNEVPAPKMKRSVSFTTIEVRTCQVEAGDHPCVSSGPAVTSGWKYNQHDSLCINRYEKSRGAPRKREQFRMPAHVRVQKLLDANVHIKDVKKAELDSMKAKKKMIKTAQSAKRPGYQRAEEVTESFKKTLKSIKKGTDQKKEERKLWERAHEEAAKKIISGTMDVDNSSFPQEVTL